MAIFVPLEESLLEPFEAPKTEVDRLKLSQQNIEKHIPAVEQNLVFTYLREHRRILQHAKELERAAGVIIYITPGLVPGDEELMMPNVEAPMPPGADYSDRHLPTACVPELPADCPPRLAAIQWSLFNAAQALNQLGGYAGHAQELREHYRVALERELARDQSASAVTDETEVPHRT
ncbi:hypothetical protein CCHL11_01497 [Colletotrichum chlorophyti]|uniref:Uncharacterized protein n=1 Tax=Colletotrichum chlorophyti TaxID=708187 RepID=A0A1Q8RYD9_9PEZI|nr:hypothetical protein CCHL11_01497 [Colletotrichum chlorophyti]